MVWGSKRREGEDNYRLSSNRLFTESSVSLENLKLVLKFCQVWQEGRGGNPMGSLCELSLLHL